MNVIKYLSIVQLKNIFIMEIITYNSKNANDNNMYCIIGIK